MRFSLGKFSKSERTRTVSTEVIRAIVSLSSATAVGLAFSSPSANAYPIFYACNSEGQLREHVDTRELQTLVLAATDESAMNQKILTLCQGRQECFSVLKQALLLTRTSVEISNELLEREVEALIANKGAELNQSIDPALSTTAKNVMMMAGEVYACRKAQEDLPEDSFRLYDLSASNPTYGDGGLILQNRIDNEFRQVTGEQRDGPSKKVSLDGIKNVIDTAVAAGVDPYAALAVNFWEEGSVEKHFTLDYSPMIDALGCPQKKGARGDDSQASRDALESKYENLSVAFVYNYGTVYTYEPGIHENAKVNEILRAHLKGVATEEVPSLYCVQKEGDFMAEVGSDGRPTGKVLAASRDYVDFSTWNVKEACCLKVPFNHYDAISDMLATKFVGDRMKSIPLGKSDPAYMLQSFNGFTPLMGITEKRGVGAFRLGINTKTDPQYGYQGMDFILNTFMNNPAIRALVEAAEERTGKKSKSVLCVGKAPGAYAIDSDYYLEKTKSAQRFVSLMGKQWDAMSEAEKSLIRHEWKMMSEMKSKSNAKLTPEENAAYRAKVEALEDVSGDAAKWAYYRNNIYPKYRKTLYQTSLRTWARVTDDDVRTTRERIWRANGALSE